jgi:hypothetical protein
MCCFPGIYFAAGISFKGLHDRPFASGDKGLLKALLQGATGFAALPAME